MANLLGTRAFNLLLIFFHLLAGDYFSSPFTLANRSNNQNKRLASERIESLFGLESLSRDEFVSQEEIRDGLERLLNKLHSVNSAANDQNEPGDENGDEYSDIRTEKKIFNFPKGNDNITNDGSLNHHERHVHGDTATYSIGRGYNKRSAGGGSSSNNHNNNNEPTRIYERVVLEGSKISISCPHASEITIESKVKREPKFKLQTKIDRHLSFRKEFVYLDQQQAAKREPKLPAQNPTFRVRWFRNHVPLTVNSNHSQTDEIQSSCELYAHSGETLQLLQEEMKEDFENEGKLNQTATKLFEFKRAEQSDVLTESNFDENVNERKRKFSNMSTNLLGFKHLESCWHINEFGELVINKISRHLNGKYTCLFAGKVSEVFLDVLSDLSYDDEDEELNYENDDIGISPFSGKSYDQELKNSSNETSDAGPAEILRPFKHFKEEEEEATRKFLTSHSNRTQFSDVRLSFDQETGNVQFNGRGASLKSRITDNTISSSTTNTSQVSLPSLSLAGQSDLRPIFKENSQVNGNSSIELNLIKSFKANKENTSARELTIAGGLSINEGNSSGDNKLENLGRRAGDDIILGESRNFWRDAARRSSEEQGNFFEKLSVTPKELDRSKIQVNIHRMKTSTSLKRNPIHMVNLETIDSNDLNSVPGFLYVKQQLYCPIERVADDILNHETIYPLIRAFCSVEGFVQKKSIKMLAENMKIVRDFRGAKIKCYRMAKHLIMLLVNLRQKKLAACNCNSTALNLSWFKDGKELIFDGERGERNFSSGIKILNSTELPNSGARNINKTFIAPKKVRKDNAPGEAISNISNSIDVSSKWIYPSLEGRILELDGVRKSSNGHYTCALKLSIAKLNQVIEHLRKLNEPDKPIRWAQNEQVGCQTNASNVNNKLRCDETILFSTINGHNDFPSYQERKTENLHIKLEKNFFVSQIKSINNETNGQFNQLRQTRTIPGSSVGEKMILANAMGERSRENGTNFGFHLLFRRLKLLKLILKEEIISEHSLDYISSVLKSVKDPLVTVQTFSVLVVERTTNSSEFWSTIVEAGNAYTRRKLANFKRLKRDHADARGEFEFTSEKAPNTHQSAPTAVASDDDLRAVEFNLNHEEGGSERWTNDNFAPQSNLIDQHYADQLNVAGKTLQSKSSIQLELRSPLEGLTENKIVARNSDQSQWDWAERKTTASELESPLIRNGNYLTARTKDLITGNEAAENSQRFESAGSPVEQKSPVVIDDAARTGLAGSYIIDGSRDDARIDGHDAERQNELAVDGKSFVNSNSGDDVHGNYQATGKPNVGPAIKLTESWPRMAKNSAINDKSRPLNERSQLNQIERTRDDGGEQFFLATDEKDKREQLTNGFKPLELFHLGKMAENSFKTASNSIQDHRASMLGGGFLNPISKSILPSNFNDEDEQDGKLMWTASQYVYIRVKASTSSSLYGGELDVEWSNEMRNKSQNFDSANGNNEKNENNWLNDNLQPFATIDVISGQYLKLECTAQALGRLPKVKWYKRIASIPSQDSGREFSNLIRKVENEFYWPLTEVDLLEPPGKIMKPKSKRFVYSESIIIFDNLTNQTFTVINSLHLSQFNDPTDQPETIKTPSASGFGSSDLNLYACIVDADVRTEFATLGVRLRQASSMKLPMTLQKRLKARSMDANQRPLESFGQSSERHLEQIKDQIGPYSFLREETLDFPVNGFWIQLHNGTSKNQLGAIVMDGLKITPTLLSIIILLVFSSLLALVYLTLHSYRTLSRQLNLEGELEEQLIENSQDTSTFKTPSDNYLMNGVVVSNLAQGRLSSGLKAKATSPCSCLIDAKYKMQKFNTSPIHAPECCQLVETLAQDHHCQTQNCCDEDKQLSQCDCILDLFEHVAVPSNGEPCNQTRNDDYGHRRKLFPVVHFKTKEQLEGHNASLDQQSTSSNQQINIFENPLDATLGEHCLE